MSQPDKHHLKGVLAVPIRITIDRLDLTAELAPTAIGELHEALTIIAPELAETEDTASSVSDEKPPRPETPDLRMVYWRNAYVICPKCKGILCSDDPHTCPYSEHGSDSAKGPTSCHDYHADHFVCLDLDMYS